MRADFSSQNYFRNPPAEIEKLRLVGPVVEVQFPIVGKIWTTTTQELADRVKAFAFAFTVVSVLFAVLLSLSTGTLNARDADLASFTFAAAQTAKRQCINTCRARYRDCLSLKQIPSSECRGIYRDCTRYTCNAGPASRPSWPGFPS
jgi:hypothetical protein